MKNSISRIILLGAVLLFLASTATASVGPKINVKSIDPAPSEPGDTVKVTLTVANDGTTSSDFRYVETETTDGIDVIGTTSGLKEDFTLCGGCQRIGTIYLKVDQSARSGTYPVDFVISPGKEEFSTTADIEVEGTPNLIVETEETHLVPGIYSNLDVTVRNIGTGRASEATLDQDEEMFSTLPQTIEFGDIEPGENVTRSARIVGDENLESGIKNLNFNLEYNNDGEETSKSVDIPVTIDNLADLAIETLESTSAVIGQPSTVTVEVENLGPGEAETISSQITCENAEVLTGKAFVGQLDDDESVPMIFEILPSERISKCSVEITYEDRTKHTITEDLDINAESSSNLLYYILILVVIAGIGIYYWRRQRQDELSEV